MASKHPVSPNPTALWAYQALAPEWGSPALLASAQAQDHRPRTSTNEGSIRTKTTGAKSPTGLRTSVLVCQYSLGHVGRGRSGRHHARKTTALRYATTVRGRSDHDVACQFVADCRGDTPSAGERVLLREALAAVANEEVAELAQQRGSGTAA